MSVDLTAARQRAEAALLRANEMNLDGWTRTDCLRDSIESFVPVARDVIALATRLELDQEKLVALSQMYEPMFARATAAETELAAMRAIIIRMAERMDRWMADPDWPTGMRDDGDQNNDWAELRRLAGVPESEGKPWESSAAHEREEAGE